MPAFDSYATVAATTAGNTVVKAKPGRLRQIAVTSTGTGSGTFVSVYDNATTNSGNVLFSLPSNAAAGTIYAVQLPADLGIVVAQVTNGPGLTVSYD
jgi:hypothetical protein